MRHTGKCVGILGGMGPAATALFYSELVNHTEAACDQDHIDVVLLGHASLPDRTNAIENAGGNTSKLLCDELVEDAETLTRAGVDAIAIPCNTAHGFSDRLSDTSGKPVINMIDAAVNRTLELVPAAETIGILCTDGTRKEGLYTRACTCRGVQAVYPEVQQQTALMKLIYDYIKRGSYHGGEGLFKETYHNVKKQGADAVILGCTELAIYKAKHVLPKDCIDSLDALVRAVIMWADKKYITK